MVTLKEVGFGNLHSLSHILDTSTLFGYYSIGQTNLHDKPSALYNEIGVPRIYIYIRKWLIKITHIDKFYYTIM